MRKARWRNGVGLALAIALALVYLVPRGFESSPGSSGDEAVGRAFAERLSDVELEFAGEVERVLPDDNEGSRHQRFIVRLATGQTILVAHNIDLAERVPLRRGDRLEVRGEYEWNERGGVVHWTHHDPRGRRTGGWVRHAGREYR